MSSSKTQAEGDIDIQDRGAKILRRRGDGLVRTRVRLARQAAGTAGARSRRTSDRGNPFWGVENNRPSITDLIT